MTEGSAYIEIACPVNVMTSIPYKEIKKKRLPNNTQL